MAMTDSELQDRILRLGEEEEALKATPEYQRWVAELRQSIADVDAGRGTPIDEFFKNFKARLKAKAGQQ